MSAGRGAVDPAQEPRPGFFAVLENALAAAEVEERPVAVLDLDAFDANLDALVRRAGGIPVRIASKSVRVRALMDRALTHPGVRGVLAYTLPEALHLAAGGIRDIVVAYPSVDARALRTLAADDDARERITVMVDEVAHLELLRAITADVLPPGARLRVALELDVSYAPLPGVRFGALRSPCRTPEGLRGLAREVLDRPELHLRGIMAYEGQIAGVGNAGRGPYPLAVRAMQALSAREIAHRRAAAVAAVRELTELEFVNGGGTGSMETTAAEAAVTEIAAGSGLIGPALFDGYRGFRPRPALHLGFSVVRRPARDVATLLGGGWIASGVPGPDRLPALTHPPGLSYSPQEAAGEVQTPVVGPGAEDLRIGDTVWMRPAKAGEAAEHVPSYQLLTGGCIVGSTPTYRGEGTMFL